MASYPNSSKVFTTKQDQDFVLPGHVNDLQAEIKAMEDQLIGSKLAKLTSLDGWIPVSDTWTYNAADKINVPSGAANIYSVGMGIRLTANGVVKQAYIVKVENTLLTVIGDALTNYTFSAISYAPNPQTAVGFPATFSWTPVCSASGGGTLTSYTSSGLLAIVGKVATLGFTVTATNASGGGYIVINTPFPLGNIVQAGIARENVVVGKAVTVHCTTTQMTLYLYDNGDTCVTNYSISGAVTALMQ